MIKNVQRTSYLDNYTFTYKSKPYIRLVRLFAILHSVQIKSKVLRFSCSELVNVVCAKNCPLEICKIFPVGLRTGLVNLSRGELLEVDGEYLEGTRGFSLLEVLNYILVGLRETENDFNQLLFGIFLLEEQKILD